MTNNKRAWEDELLTLQRKQGLEIEDRGEETEWGAVQIHEETKAFIRKVEDTARKEVLISLQNEVDKIKDTVRQQTGSFKYDSCYDDVLSLIEKYKQ